MPSNAVVTGWANFTGVESCSPPSTLALTTAFAPRRIALATFAEMGKSTASCEITNTFFVATFLPATVSVALPETESVCGLNSQARATGWLPSVTRPLSWMVKTERERIDMGSRPPEGVDGSCDPPPPLSLGVGAGAPGSDGWSCGQKTQSSSLSSALPSLS